MGPFFQCTSRLFDLFNRYSNAATKAKAASAAEAYTIDRRGSSTAPAPAQPDDGVARKQAANVAALEALRLEQQKFNEAKRLFAQQQKEVADHQAAKVKRKERKARERQMAEQARVAAALQRRVEEERGLAEQQRRQAEEQRVADQQRRQAEQRGAVHFADLSTRFAEAASKRAEATCGEQQHQGPVRVQRTKSCAVGCARTSWAVEVPQHVMLRAHPVTDAFAPTRLCCRIAPHPRKLLKPYGVPFRRWCRAPALAREHVRHACGCAALPRGVAHVPRCGTKGGGMLLNGPR